MEGIPSYGPDLTERHVSCWNSSLKKLRNSTLDEKLKFASLEEFVNFVREAKKREDEQNWNDDPSFRSPLSIRCLAEDPLRQDPGSLLSMLPKKIWLFQIFLKLDAEDLMSLSSVNTTLRSWLLYQPNLSSSPFGDNLWVCV
jgi:hypothetical protein